MTEDTFLLDYIFKEAELYKDEENGLKVDYNRFKIRKNDLVNKFVNHCNKLDFDLEVEKQSGYDFSDALLNMTKNKAETLLEELIMKNIVRLEDDVCYITENGYDVFKKEYAFQKSIHGEIEDFKYLPKEYVDYMIKLLDLENNKQ